MPAFVPLHMQDRFRGFKSIPPQNVLAAVDFDLRFIYVLAGWEGSAHDSLVLQDALSRPTRLKIPEGRISPSSYCEVIKHQISSYLTLGGIFYCRKILLTWCWICK